MPKAPAQRLLLIEFFATALRRNEKSMLFPFLQGLARERGVETLWVCFGGDYAQAPSEASGRTIQARLPASDLRALRAHLQRFKPTHVITSDILSPGAKALLASPKPAPRVLVMGVLPDAVWGVSPKSEVARHMALVSGDPASPDYFGRCAWFLRWLGLEARASDKGYLVAVAPADYAAVLANAAARKSPAHITLVSGGLCGDRRKLSRNPYFKGVDLEGDAGHYGCSFCSSASMPFLSPPGEDIVPFVKKQFQGIVATAGKGGRDKGIYEFFDFRALLKFDEVFAVVLRLKLPPSVFLFNPRIDDVLRVQGRIARALPALAKAGHEVRFLSMGIENFSERENRRFNKDITLAQVDEFLALARKWESLYPGVFRPFKAGHDKVELGFILYTPWTTLSDLRLNLTRARERRFAETGYWLYSTLHIRSVEPIHRLARQEGGILEGAWPDRGQGYGLVKNEGEAGPLVPWRFKDRRAADHFALLVRVCAADREGAGCAFFRGDREFALAARLYELARKKVEATPLGFALALLALLEAAPEGYSREDLLRRALDCGPDASREAHAAHSALRSLERARPAALAIETVETLPGRGVQGLRLTFSSGRRKVVVDLFDAGSPGPSFLRSRLFRCVYRPDAPVSDPAQARYLAQALRLIDAAVEKARAAQPARGLART